MEHGTSLLDRRATLRASNHVPRAQFDLSNARSTKQVSQYACQGQVPMIPSRARKQFRKTFGIERRYFGLNDIDRKLEHWIDFDNGTYVEAGANNGITQSNTYYFEKFRGWSGLLIEPIPEKAKECRRNRPNSIIENCALGSMEQDNSVLNLTYCDLMTVAEGSMASPDAISDHVSKGSSLQKVKSYDFRIACHSLSALLEKHNLRKIDLLSLDVEGFEVNVLDGLDLDAHAPSYILVEARDMKNIMRRLSHLYNIVEHMSHHDILLKKHT